MGVQRNVGFAEWPKQGDKVGADVLVCFNYETELVLKGIIVRDDREDPWRTIILLQDGRHVLATECHYSFPRDDGK